MNFIMIWLVMLWPINDIYCAIISSERTSLVGEKDEDIVLKYRLHDIVTDSFLKFFFNGTDDDKLFAFFSYNINNIEEAITTKPRSNHPFQNRVSGKCSIRSGNGTCELRISYLSFKDFGNIRLINGGLGKVLAEFTTFIDTRGGPELCGDHHLPNNLTSFIGHQFIGTTTFCGKPQPNVTWYLDGEKINGTVDVSKKEEHQYSYSFKLLATEDLQGRNITYRAIGYKKREITGKTTLFVIMRSNFRFRDGSISLTSVVAIVIAIIAVVVVITIMVLCHRRLNSSNNQHQLENESIYVEK